MQTSEIQMGLERLERQIRKVNQEQEVSQTIRKMQNAIMENLKHIFTMYIEQSDEYAGLMATVLVASWPKAGKHGVSEVQIL